MARYRLLAGGHLEADPAIGKDVNGLPQLRNYRPGDVIETDTDLCERFNPKDKAFPKKFELVHDEGPITTEEAARRGFATAFSDGGQKSAPIDAKMTRPGLAFTDAKGYNAWLEKQSVEELKAHAADEEIDLRGASSKDTIIKTLRSAFTSVTPPLASAK